MTNKKFETLDGFSTQGDVTISGNVAVDTDVLFVDAVNNRVGIGKTPTTVLDVDGNITATNVNATFYGDGSNITGVVANSIEGVSADSFLRADANDTFTGDSLELNAANVAITGVGSELLIYQDIPLRFGNTSTPSVSFTFSRTGPTAGDLDITTNGTVGITVTNDFTVVGEVDATTLSGNGASITSVDADTVGGNTAVTLRAYSDSTSATAYSNATSYADTKAATAYSNATSYADTVAGTAYSNAVANAVALASEAYSNATSYADTVAGTAYSNATSYADTVAGTAYSNATSYADTKAATAYSNATSYADTAADTAYANAVSRANHTGTQLLSTISDAGSIASQDANNVNIDGGAIDGTPIGASTANTGKFSALTITNEIVEGIHTITGTTPVLDPANGTVQTWTLSGASTPTDGLSNGESMVILIDDGGDYTITWPSTTWIGGSAPTLDTANETVVELWKVGGTLYGALVGVAS